VADNAVQLGIVCRYRTIQVDPEGFSNKKRSSEHQLPFVSAIVEIRLGGKQFAN